LDGTIKSRCRLSCRNCNSGLDGNIYNDLLGGARKKQKKEKLQLTGGGICKAEIYIIKASRGHGRLALGGGKLVQVNEMKGGRWVGGDKKPRKKGTQRKKHLGQGINSEGGKILTYDSIWSK